MFSRHLSTAFLTAVVLCGSAGSAAAQFRYYNPYIPAYGYGYSPYAYGSDPYGGYLSGAAGVVSAEGQYNIASQQAYLLQQGVRAAQMDNHRKAFDEWLYERAHMPTLNDERKRIQDAEAERARNQPPDTEIWAGKSLNDLLNNIKQTQARGTSGPDVPLNSSILAQINVTGTGQGNCGLLKDVGNLKWPIGLQTLPDEKEAATLRDKIGKDLSSATDQVASGNLNPQTITGLTANVKRMRSMLLANVDDMSFTDYTAAKRYLGQLDDAVTVLKSPSAISYVNGKYAAKGKTVKELVAYMFDNGLSFAPAIRGEEAAYNALYNALLTYDVQTVALTADPSSTSPPPSK